jgi:hypothetical protein
VPQEPNITLTVTPNELHTLTSAMRGDHPPALDRYRMGLLRKLTRATILADMASEQGSAAA